MSTRLLLGLAGLCILLVFLGLVMTLETGKGPRRPLAGQARQHSEPPAPPGDADPSPRAGRSERIVLDPLEIKGTVADADVPDETRVLQTEGLPTSATAVVAAGTQSVRSATRSGRIDPGASAQGARIASAEDGEGNAAGESATDPAAEPGADGTDEADSDDGVATEDERSVWTPAPTSPPLPSVTPAGDGVVVGQVVGIYTGSGVPDTVVTCAPASLHAFPHVAISDTSGRFAVYGLAPGDYVIRAEGSEMAVQRYVADGIETVVELLVPERTQVSGSVLDQDGRPVADALVYLYRLPDRALIDETSTDGKGVYALLNAIPGVELEVTAQLPGFAADSQRIFLDSLEPRYDVDLVLAQGRIVGRVESSNGSSLSNVAIAAVPLSGADGAAVGTALTGADGRYALEPILPGEWELTAAREGYAKVQRRVRVTRGNLAPEVNFTLARGRPLTGVVVDDRTGKPIAGATVYVRHADSYQESTTAADGTFDFAFIDYDKSPDVVARHPDYSTSHFQKPPESGEPIVIRLSELCTLVLRVLDAELNVVPRYTISFHPHSIPDHQFRDYPSGAEVETEDVATWRLGWSRYRLDIQAPGFEENRFEVNDLRPGETLELNLQLR